MFNQEKPKVAAAQKVMLEILCEFHRVCEKNHLTYWLEGGTLLGAVRHHGFIPWDDDMDVAMPIDDYKKFCEIARKELKSDYFFQTKVTDAEYNIGVPKIRKNGTVLIETGESGEENYHHGIFIDIFPYTSYKSGIFLDLVRWSYNFRDKRKQYAKGSWKRVLMTFYTNVIMALPVAVIVMIRNYCVRHRDMFKDDENLLYYSHLLGVTNVRRMLRKYVLPAKLGSNNFEGMSFFVPADEEEYLKVYYGDDFMSLPSVNRRQTHAKLIKC